MIEALVTLGILAILAGMALPAMQELIARRRVAAVATELASDLRYLTSSAVQRNMQAQIDVKSACYVLSFDFAGSGACNCLLAAPCGSGSVAPVVLKVVTLPSSAGVSFSSVRANTLFNTKGLSVSGNPVDVTVNSTSGGKVHVYTQGAMNRPYACSLANQESNFPACPAP